MLIPNKEKEMKKLHLMAIMSIFALVLIMTGCINVLSPSTAHDRGNGNVTVSFLGGSNGKLIQPSASGFDEYKFTFTRDSSVVLTRTIFKEEMNTTGAFNFSLPQGSGYSLTVDAFKSADPEPILAAKGTKGSINVGSSTKISVLLQPESTIGQGTLEFVLKLPASAKIDYMNLLAGSKTYDLSLNVGSPIPYEPGIIILSGAMNVDAGWYWLEMELKASSSVAGHIDLVSIYPNTTSFFGTLSSPKDFVSDELWKPVDKSGEETFYWPVKYDESGLCVSEYHNGVDIVSLGTSFETFNFFAPGDNHTWKDVLKLTPPPLGGYEKGYALTYDNIQTGVLYEMSMKIWVEGSAEILWQHLNYGNPSWPIFMDNGWEEYQNGWHSLSKEFTLSGSGTTSIGLLAKDDDDQGLHNATIYIRDFKLERKGAGGSVILESTPNGAGTPISFVLSHSSLDLARSTPAETYTRTITASKPATWSASPSGYVTINTINGGLAAEITAPSSGLLGNVTITAKTTETPSESRPAFVTVVAPGSKHIALTFDDGPGDNITLAILNKLDAQGAKATFFVRGDSIGTVSGSGSSTGYNVRPEAATLLLRMNNTGYEIANHSYSHRPDLSVPGNQVYSTTYSNSNLQNNPTASQINSWLNNEKTRTDRFFGQFFYQIVHTDGLIGAALGKTGYNEARGNSTGYYHKTLYFRPPQGKLHNSSGSNAKPDNCYERQFMMFIDSNYKNTSSSNAQYTGNNFTKSFILSDIDSNDWMVGSLDPEVDFFYKHASGWRHDPIADRIYNNIISGNGNRIILMHDYDLDSANAIAKANVIEKAIIALKAEGFAFVTITEFLSREKKTLGPGDSIAF